MSLRDRAARLQEGRALLASAGDVEAFDALPQDVEGTLEALRGRQRALARQVAESGRSLAQMNEQMERFTFREERILEKAEEIDRLNAQLPMLQQSGQQLPELMEKAQQASAQAARYMTERLGDPFGLGQGNSLPLARLQAVSYTHLVCTSSSRKESPVAVGTCSVRFMPDTIPAVTVCWKDKSKGVPMAATGSPTASSSTLPSVTGEKGPPSSHLTTARSSTLSLHTAWASSRVPSLSTTVMVSASPAT